MTTMTMTTTTTIIKKNYGKNNHNQVSEDNTDGNASYNDYDVYDGDSEDNYQDDHDPPGGLDHNPEDEEHEDDNVDELGGNGQDVNNIKQVEEDTGPGRRRSRRTMHYASSPTKR